MKVCPKCGGRFPAESRFCEFDGQPLIEEPVARPDTQSQSSKDALRTSPYHRVTQKYCRECYAFLTSDATSCRTCGSSDLIEIGKPMAGNVDFDAHAVQRDMRIGRYKNAAQKCIDSGFESMEANFIMAKLLICGKVDDMGQDELEKEVKCFKKHFESIPEDERFKFGIIRYSHWYMDSHWMMRAGNNRFLGGNVMRGIAHLQAAMRQGLSFERLMRVVNICMWKNRFRQAVYLVPKFFKVLLFMMPKVVVEDVIFDYPKGLWRQLEYICGVAFCALLFVGCICSAICEVVDFLLHTPASSIILLTTAIMAAFLCVVYVICVIAAGVLRRDSIKCLSFMTSEDPYYEDPYYEI